MDALPGVAGQPAPPGGPRPSADLLSGLLQSCFGAVRGLQQLAAQAGDEGGAPEEHSKAVRISRAVRFVVQQRCGG